MREHVLWQLSQPARAKIKTVKEYILNAKQNLKIVKMIDNVGIRDYEECQ